MAQSHFQTLCSRQLDIGCVRLGAPSPQGLDFFLGETQLGHQRCDASSKRVARYAAELVVEVLAEKSPQVEVQLRACQGPACLVHKCWLSIPPLLS